MKRIFVNHLSTTVRMLGMLVFFLVLAPALGLASDSGGVLLGVGAAAGYPTGGSGGVSRYTVEMYAKKLLIKFYKKTVYGEIANRDYEGEISKQGDKVIIRTRPDVTVFKYVKGMDLRTKRQNPESANKELTISEAMAYSVGIDDIDKIQNDINALDEWAQDGSEQLGIAIDRDILNTVYVDADATNKGATAGKISKKWNLGTAGSPVTLDKTNILDYIVYCDSVLSENDIPLTDRWMIIPEWAKALLNTSDLKNASFTGDQSNTVLRNGKMGMLSNFTLYASNNLMGVTDGANTCYNLQFGHKSALTFASQLVKNRVLELQDTFGTVQEGLHVYGYEVVKPEAMGVLYAK